MVCVEHKFPRWEIDVDSGDSLVHQQGPAWVQEGPYDLKTRQWTVHGLPQTSQGGVGINFPKAQAHDCSAVSRSIGLYEGLQGHPMPAMQVDL